MPEVTQCSTSEIGDAPLYNSCTLPIQVMTTGPLSAPSKCKSGQFNVPRVMKTKFPATVMVFSVVSSEGHIMPPHIFEVSLKVNTKVYLDVLIPWCNQVASGRPLGMAAGLGAGSQVQRDPGLSLEGVLRLCTLLSLAPLLSRPEPTGLLRLVIRWEHHQHDLPQHQSQHDRQYLPSSHWRLWKRHAPSSGYVSRQRLKLKVATLNRCQLYYINKWPELIFSIKVFK